MLNTNFHENDNILNSVDESEVQLKKNQQERRVQQSPFIPHQYQVRRSGNFGFENYIWKQNALNILTLVLRFIKILTQTCFTQQFNLLNEKLFNIIGDVTSDFQYYSLKDYFKDQKPMQTERFCVQFCQNQYKKFVETYFVKQILEKLIQFKPESMFLFIWNIYILFILNLSLLYISAKFAFKLDERNSIYESYRYSFLYLLPLFSFVVEFILKLNTQFYEKGQLIDNRKEIIKHYLKTGFTLDLIIILSQILNFYAKINHLDLLILLKIFQIPSLLEHLLDKLELTNYHFAIYDLSRLCYFILIETHFVCCGWYFVGSLNEDKNWLKQLDIEDTDWIIQYSHSFYWSIVTMTTIGYGDVIPQNIYEKYFVIIVALISCCTFGYSISNIGQIFAQLSKKQNQARIDLNNLKKYLKQKKYSSDIQIKVLRYFEYIWSDEHIDNVQNFQHFQSLLPCQLKNDMILDLNLKALKKVPFLQQKFSEQFLTQLSVLFQEEIYGPDQIIFQRNTQSNYFYILLEGAVELYIDLSCIDGKEKKTLLETINSEYSILGHKEFFSETVYNVNCKAINSARCIRVKREDFRSVAEKYGWQQYCQIRDLLQQTGKNDEVLLTCFGCKKKSHMITQCPLTTGFPNKTKIILNYRKKYQQDRHYYKRKNVERRMHSVKDENDISDSVLCYLLRDQTLRQKFQNHFQFETTDSQVSIKKYEKNINSKHKRKNLRFVFQQFARPSYMRELQNIAKQQNIYQYDTEIQQVIQDEISESERVKLDNDLCKSVNYKLKVDAGQTYPFLNKFEPKSIVKQSQQRYDESLDIQKKKDKSRMLAESIRIIGINASSLRNELFSDSNINYEQQSYYPKKNENSHQTSIGLKMGKYQEIFNDFDRAQNYENYLTHMNLNIILTEFEEMQNQKGLYNFLNQNIKQKSRKQTIFILKH